jgi:hypothetical protein
MVKDELLLYLRRSDVRALCKNLDCVGLLREAFSLHASEQTIVPEEAYLGWRNGSQQLRSLGMPAYVGGRFQTAIRRISTATSLALTVLLSFMITRQVASSALWKERICLVLERPP